MRELFVRKLSKKERDLVYNLIENKKYGYKGKEVIFVAYNPHFHKILRKYFPDMSKRKLDWQPKVKFDELVKIMVNEDLKNGNNGYLVKNFRGMLRIIKTKVKYYQDTIIWKGCEMIEKIKDRNNNVIAIIIRKCFEKKGINFISEENFPLQLGVNVYSKGDIIKAHIHKERNITINRIQEVVHIEKGRVKVDLYDLDAEKIRTVELSAGDTILFVNGGHGFEVLEDTKIIEVKQGPYLGREEDKTYL
jgi:hypothetical protein